MSSYSNLSWKYNSRILPVLEEGEWYNLGTKRKIRNIKPEHYALLGLPYIGTREELENFWRENLSSLSEFYQEGEFLDFLTLPYESLETLVHQMKCNLKIDTLPILFSEKNLYEISQDVLDSLCNFQLTGIFTPGRLIRVIDGDTFDVAIQLHLNQLAELCINQKRCMIVNKTFEDEKIILRIRCRIYGIDTVEKDTEEGMKMKNELSQLLSEPFWIEIFSNDKYGRYLVALYRDKKKETLLRPSKYQTYTGGKKR